MPTSASHSAPVRRDTIEVQQQELPHLGALALQHLGHQVIDDLAIVASEGGDVPLGIPTPPQR